MTTRFLNSALTILALAAYPPGTLAFGSLDPFNVDPKPPTIAFATSGQEISKLPCTALQTDAKYSVLDVIDQALCRNPKTHEAWANARSQAALVGAAQAAYLPDLDGKISASRYRSGGDNTTQRSASLTLSWLLYDFGARAASLENARQLLVAATSTMDATLQTVFLSALQAYYTAQAARAALIAAGESEKSSAESLSASEVRYRVGTGTPADRLQAKTAWSQATLNRIKAEGALKTALGELAHVMGLEAHRPFLLDDIPDALPEAAFDTDVAALIEEARLRRPDLKAAEAQAKAALANVEATRATGRPSLSFGATPGWQESDGISSHGRSIGLTLTIPLFSGFETGYRVRSAIARADATAAQLEAARLQTALDVWSAYQSLNTVTQSLRTSADLLASATQSERVAMGRYKAGAGNLLELLNAQSALAAARQQLIQARLDWNVYRATLAKAVGTLDNTLLTPASGTPTP